MKKFNGKVVVVTGGSRGIGKSTVEKFYEEGATVVILARSMKGAQDVAISLDHSGKRCVAFDCDVSDADCVKRTVSEIIKLFGKIDILVNNAGITQDAMVHKMTQEQWCKVIDVNLTGTFNMINAIVPYMREKKYGKIINISSSSAYGNVGQSNYAASKAGIIGLTKSLAKELGRYSINANVILPGFILTDIVDTIPEKVVASLLLNTPLGRAGLPEEIAYLIRFLASDEASFITGIEVPITGGMLIV